MQQVTDVVPEQSRPTPVDAPDADLDAILTHATGPIGSLPLDAEMLRDSPSGDLFGLTQNAGMGWEPRRLRSPEFLILGTQGGIRAPDGRPIALGYHTGHWEIGLLMQEAALELDRGGATPFAGFVSDPCDGRTQGTLGMMESLAYRNDAAIVFRRLIRSLPTRRGVMGVATCDKGLPAMMLALAAQGDLPVIIVPGGVTLPPTVGEHAGAVQTVGVRFTHGKLTLREAAELGCAACATPGGGCQFLGTAATSQVVAEALGLALCHSALAPSGQPVWLELARRSARALQDMAARGRWARRTSSPTTRSTTRWSCTRRSAARPTCCCTCPRSRTRRASAGPASRTGRASTAPCRASSACCRTAPSIIRRCASSSPAACRR